MNEQPGGIRGFCLCGAQVWHGQSKDQLPRPQEAIICRACGRDNSRRPSLFWLLKFYKRRLDKRRRAYGVRGMWRAHYPVPFWQIRSYPRGYHEKRAQGLLPYQSGVALQQVFEP